MPTREDGRDYAAERSPTDDLTERQMEALMWRRRGLSIPQIGRRMEVSHQRASQLVTTALSKMREWSKDEADHERELALTKIDDWSRRLERIVHRWETQKAQVGPLTDGKIVSDEMVVKTIAQLHRIEESRRRLTGLDRAPGAGEEDAPWKTLLVRVTREVDEQRDTKTRDEDVDD